MSGLFLVHAHPDDEAFSTGGVMLKAHREGRRVVLVTATRGEAGEIHNMDPEASRPRLAEIRAEELRRAAEILGVDRQEFLGYRDSGMAGTPENDDPASFHQAPLGEAAQRLAALLREERPDVVVTYDPTGTYGHPDHIKSHRVTMAALDALEKEGWEPAKAYWQAIPRSGIEEFGRRLEVEGKPNPFEKYPIGVPDEEITTIVDVREFVDHKRRAFQAHVSQNAPDSFFSDTASDFVERAFGTETFIIARGHLGAPRPEPDLFTGIVAPTAG